MLVRVLLVLSVLVPLGGCGLLDTWVWVSRTHDLPANGGGQSVAIVTQDNQIDKPVFIAQVGEALVRHGYRLAPSFEQAQLVAIMSYRNEGCTSNNRSVPTYSTRHDGKRWVQVQTGSRIQIDRACKLTLVIAIHTGAAYRKGDLVHPLYQGSATSILPSEDIDVVAPLLIAALFIDFPGTSGVTQRESIARRDL